MPNHKFLSTYIIIPFCLVPPVLPLASAGVEAFLGLLPQTCLVFRPPVTDFARSYHVSSSLARSTDDLLDEPLLDPRLEHLPEDSRYVGLLRSTLLTGFGGRSKFSVELVRERGSLPLLKEKNKNKRMMAIAVFIINRKFAYSRVHSFG